MLCDDELMLWVVHVCCVDGRIFAYNCMCYASWCTDFGPIMGSGVSSWCLWWDQWSVVDAMVESVMIFMCYGSMVGSGASALLPYNGTGEVLLIQWWN